ncbi:hypothetical protein D9756_009732 [Leucocoprinus leucothites]|uniref:Zn(2)-C6 fungal-type domain-containing protein n=1 Tax=Leucocoprinus leucothites TaxID=201217 RepID=A0A8H5FTW9_9AGAR|nr:hypothetical protein D9756_009732 [Leucoagaricus leucothites]
MLNHTAAQIRVETRYGTRLLGAEMGVRSKRAGSDDGLNTPTQGQADRRSGWFAGKASQRDDITGKDGEFAHSMFYPHIKAEASTSPDLTFHFKFPPSHDHPSHSPEDPPTPLYRFGSYPHSASPNNHHHPYMSYSDDYDDVVPYSSGQLSASAAERTVRRRSSKACDQCRKSKCKCERSGLNEPCKSCIILGTPCTFLGPSRKRGPPKGYIDAIEARLHQTEALVGIMLSSRDSRAQSLLRDIAQARIHTRLVEIITRVDNSPYGVKGRKRASEASASTSGSSKKADSSAPGVPKEKESEKLDLTSTHPSNEWQDNVIDMLGAGRTGEPAYVRATPSTNGKPSLRVATYSSDDNARSEDGRERQRRRLGDEDYGYDDINPSLPSPASTSASVPHSAGSVAREEESARDGEDEKLLAQAVGELSINEDEEVRYHGQASGLYLLGVQERVDNRNEGGIWRFPGARVWPPLPSVAEGMAHTDSDVPTAAEQAPFLRTAKEKSVEHSPIMQRADSDQLAAKYLPPRGEQERLLELGNTNLYLKRNRRIAPLLLLAMFAVAARYDVPAPNPSALAFPSPSASESSRSSTSTTPLPTDGATMWAAGEEYFSAAKSLLDTSYTSSRSCTCQALLLMGYREIGIGAMALAWTYIGMAIRMAQDLAQLLREKRKVVYLETGNSSEEMEDWKSLGVDGQWTTPVPGRVVSCFNKCAELSGILSSIIQAIYAVRPFASTTGTLGSPIARPAGRQAETVKQAAILEGVLNKWYLDLPEHLRYDIAATPDRDASSSIPPAHILTLHMQYWCAVLLLHRPFIRRALNKKARAGSDDSSDSDDVGLINSRKSYELCASAANHITSIVTAYHDHYPLNRSSVFLCYYVFTASIMHVISMSAYPDDPQAHINLRRCLAVLTAMRYVWPSAERALVLLKGAKTNLTTSPGTSAPAATGTNALRRDAPSAGNGNKRKSTLEDEAQNESISLQPPINGIFGSTGEYVAPIRSGATPQVHHAIHRQTSQRELAQATTLTSPIHPPSYPAATRTYAIQPPSLLATADYQWAEGRNVGAASNLSPVLTSGESHLRVASGQLGDQLHPEEDPEFSGPLSTSVLPQLYSTGLVDEQGLQSSLTASSHRPSQTQTHRPVHAHPQPQYPHQYSHASKVPPQVQPQPQYWSDYSTFSQLGTTADAGGVYNGLGMGVGGASEIDLTLQENPHPSVHHQHPHQHHHPHPHPHSQHQQHPHQQHTLSHQPHSNLASLPGMYMSAPYESYGE